MPRVIRGNPRSRQLHSGANGSAIGRAGAANPVIDGKSIWIGRPVGLFSIPNPEDDVHYIRVEVGNLKNAEYDLCFERGTLNSAERLYYPINHEPDYAAQADPLLHVNKYSDAQSGAMFRIPPQSRVHVAIRLTTDRKDLLEFPVAIYEHAGPDLDSPAVDPTPRVKPLEWIPAPTADSVETRVFSTTGKFLFWDLEPEPDWVRFRRWNVDPRPGRFPWSLGLFHHPECIVRVTNNSPLPVSVSPRLVLDREDTQGNIVRQAQEEVLLDTRAALAPGEEREWPCPISLDDRRLAKQQADQLRVSAYADVLGPSNTPIGKVEAPERIRGEYISYPSKIIDFVVLVGGVVFVALLLIWLFVGIPRSVTPKIALKLEFIGFGDDDLPNGINEHNPLSINLTSTDQRFTSDPNRTTHERNSNVYMFEFNTATVWQRPFVSNSQIIKYSIQIHDSNKTMEFNTEQPDYPLILYPPTGPQVIKVDSGQSPSVALRKEAGDLLSSAQSDLTAAVQSMKQGQAVPDQVLRGASDNIDKASKHLDDAKAPPDAPERAALLSDQKLLSTATQQQVKLLGAKGAEQQAETYLNEADKIVTAIGRPITDVPSATSQAKKADAIVKNATQLMAPVKDAEVLNVFDQRLKLTSDPLTQLWTDIGTAGGKGTDPIKHVKGGGDPELVPNIKKACDFIQLPQYAMALSREAARPGHLELNFQVNRLPGGDVQFTCSPSEECVLQIYEIYSNHGLPQFVLPDPLHPDVEKSVLVSKGGGPWSGTPGPNTIAYVAIGMRSKIPSSAKLLDLLTSADTQDVSGWAISTQDFKK